MAKKRRARVTSLETWAKWTWKSFDQRVLFYSSKVPDPLSFHLVPFFEASGLLLLFVLGHLGITGRGAHRLTTEIHA